MATQNTPNQAIPYLDKNSALKDVPDFTKALALALEKKVVGVYASQSDWATKTGGTYATGLAYLQAENKLMLYTGSTFVQVWPAKPVVTSGTAAPVNGNGSAGDLYIQF